MGRDESGDVGVVDRQAGNVDPGDVMISHPRNLVVRRTNNHRVSPALDVPGCAFLLNAVQ